MDARIPWIMKETGLRQGQTPLDIIRMSCHGYSFMRCDVYWRNVVLVHLEPSRLPHVAGDDGPDAVNLPRFSRFKGEI